MNQLSLDLIVTVLVVLTGGILRLTGETTRYPV
jgi:hypothetical protein